MVGWLIGVATTEGLIRGGLGALLGVGEAATGLLGALGLHDEFTWLQATFVNAKVPESRRIAARS